MAKRDKALLTRVHTNLGTLLDRTLQRLVDQGKDVPAALASAAGNYLKLHAVDAEIEREAVQERADAVAFNWETRFPPKSVEEICERYALDPVDHVNIAIKAREWAKKCEASGDTDTAKSLVKIAEAAEEAAR